MACPTIITGDAFLSRTIAHIDCQAQVIGSYGYLALGQPGSLASILVTGLLTLFIGLFGIRLLFGPPPGARDLVMDVLKTGIVLTLAFSWPAFQTVVYEVTLKGPAGIASAIQSGVGGPSGAALIEQLQTTDNAITDLTAVGTGRNTGELINRANGGASFQGSALQDETAFGSARLLYLASVIGSLGLLRIGAGILLALAPIVAGLYFFPQSRGIFAGWFKALVFTFAGSIATTILLFVQMAVVEPWLSDALRVRSLGYAIPSAPTELLAIMLGFLVVHLTMLWLVAKAAFYRGWITLPDFPNVNLATLRPEPIPAAPTGSSRQKIVHAQQISSSIKNSIRREKSLRSEQLLMSASVFSQSGTTRAVAAPSAHPRLGSSYQRMTTRPTRTSQARDQSR